MLKLLGNNFKYDIEKIYIVLEFLHKNIFINIKIK